MKILILLFAITVALVPAKGISYEHSGVFKAQPYSGGDIPPFPFKKAPLPWKDDAKWRTINPDKTAYDFVKNKQNSSSTLVTVSQVDLKTGRVLARGSGQIKNNVLQAQLVRNGRLFTVELKAYYSSRSSSQVSIMLSVIDVESDSEKHYRLISQDCLAGLDCE